MENIRKDTPYLNYGTRDSIYNALVPAIAERFSEHFCDWANASKNRITRRLIQYLARRGKKEELQRIYARLGIPYSCDKPENLMGNSDKEKDEYEKLSLNAGFQILVLRTFQEDDFDYRKTVNVQGYAGAFADSLEKILKED